MVVAFKITLNKVSGINHSYSFSVRHFEEGKLSPLLAECQTLMLSQESSKGKKPYSSVFGSVSHSLPSISQDHKTAMTNEDKPFDGNDLQELEIVV